LWPRLPGRYLLIGILLAHPIILEADGCIWYQLEESGTTDEESVAVAESAQHVLLYYDLSGSTESLVLSVETAEMAGGFVWVIPLPYIPASPTDAAVVLESPTSGTEDDLLSLVAAYAEPRISVTRHYYTVEPVKPFRFGFGCALPAESGDAVDLKGSDDPDDLDWNVDVLESGATDNFDYTQISCGEYPDGSPDISSLLSWLHAHGFGYPSSGADSIIASYAEQDYSFLVVSGRETDTTGAHSQLSITFPTSRIVYPMAISSLGLGPAMDLAITVCCASPLSPLSVSVTDFLLAYLYNEGSWIQLSRENPSNEATVIHGGSEPYAWMLLSPTEATGEQFQSALIEEVAQRRRNGVFWQDAALSLTNSGDAELFAALGAALPEDAVVPGELWLTAFFTCYTDPAEMFDIVFQPAAQAEFQAEVFVHVDIEESTDDASRSDLSLAFPVLFLVWTQASRRRSRAGQRRRG
jgi:hypothetical protein